MGKVLIASEIADLLGVSEWSGYKIIRTLNSELEEKGFLTFQGRVSTAYFFERYNLTLEGVRMTDKATVKSKGQK